MVRARSSVRLIRQREAARKQPAQLNREIAASLAREFRAGYAAVTADMRAGMTAEQAFDLATTTGSRRSAAYTDGANAARHVVGGHLAYAEKIANSYGVKL